MRRIFFILTLAFLVCGFQGLHAQISGLAIGPKAGIYLSAGKLMLGAIGEIPITRDIDFEPGVETVLGIPSTTLIDIDGNIRYSFTLPGETIRPFALLGFGIQLQTYATTTQSGSNTNTGFRLNLGGGLVFNSRSLIQYWAGLKLYLLEGNDAALQGGVLFYL
ncbi:MAG: hypothetical protein JWQ98_1574 [Chlorobi bacterium]|jgi:hypothetical protein|nr:hypothetical protein [Chlorobiota bacterium]